MAESRRNRGGGGRAGSDLTPLGSLLGNVASLGRGRRISADAWRRAVGDRISRRTEPGPLSSGKLTVHVASPTWAQELSFFSDAIAARLRDEGVEVNELRFRVQRVQPAPRSSSPVRKRGNRVPLSPELVERLSKIDDAELREAIAEAASYAAGVSSAKRR